MPRRSVIAVAPEAIRLIARNRRSTGITRNTGGKSARIMTAMVREFGNARKFLAQARFMYRKTDIQ